MRALYLLAALLLALGLLCKAPPPVCAAEARLAAVEARLESLQAQLQRVTDAVFRRQDPSIGQLKLFKDWQLTPTIDLFAQGMRYS